MINRRILKLKELHNTENNINKEMADIDKQIKGNDALLRRLYSKKQKLAKRVSHNMQLRNKIINELKSEAK